jgi:hypothetical protein
LAPSIDLSAVRVGGEHELATGDRMTTCVAGYLPRGAFAGGTANLGWMCEERDPRVGARKLRAALLSGSAGEFTKAVQLVSAAGWYQMPIYAAVRIGCCADPKPLVLPEPAEGCPRMDRSLNELGGDVVAARDHQPALKGYTEAVQCATRTGRARVYGQTGAPGVEHRMVFEHFVKLLRSP